MNPNKTISQNTANNKKHKKTIKISANPIFVAVGLGAGLLLASLICTSTLEEREKEIYRLRKVCEEYARYGYYNCDSETARANFWQEASIALTANVNNVADDKTLEKFYDLTDKYVKMKHDDLNYLSQPEYVRKELVLFTEMLQYFKTEAKQDNTK